MHDKARLVTPFPALMREIGELIAIEDIEDHFLDSQSANAKLEFQCADPTCAVPCKAALVKLAKVNRKRSPSSYFYASKRSTPHTCDLHPKPNELLAAPAETVLAASPSRGASPAKWIDPLVLALKQGGHDTLPMQPTSHSHSASDGRGGVQSVGNGTSRGTSQRIERFAKEWQKLTVNERKSKELVARWNPRASYYSAFHPLMYWPDIRQIQNKIVVATVKAVYSYSSGFAIELAQRCVTGVELRFWIPNQCMSFKPDGATLREQLNLCVASKQRVQGKEVFALGTFVERTVSGRKLRSLEIPHPHYMWLTSP